MKYTIEEHTVSLQPTAAIHASVPLADVGWWIAHLGQRYDAFIWCEQTTAVHPLHTQPAHGELETYPQASRPAPRAPGQARERQRAYTYDPGACPS